MVCMGAIFLVVPRIARKTNSPIYASHSPVPIRPTLSVRQALTSRVRHVTRHQETEGHAYTEAGAYPTCDVVGRLNLTRLRVTLRLSHGKPRGFIFVCRSKRLAGRYRAPGLMQRHTGGCDPRFPSGVTQTQYACLRHPGCLVKLFCRSIGSHLRVLAAHGKVPDGAGNCSLVRLSTGSGCQHCHRPRKVSS